MFHIHDTDLSDILTAIQSAIEAGHGHAVTVRIPVRWEGRIVAWYTVRIERERADRSGGGDLSGG